MRISAALPLSVLATLAVALSAPAAQAATTTVGSTTLTAVPNINPDALGQNIPVFQGDAAGNYVLASPVAGVITSWSFRSAGVTNGAQFVLRVLRPAGDSWTAVGTTGPVAVSSATGNDALLGPFATHLAIAAGDRIALQPTDGSDTPIETTNNHGDGMRFFDHPLADGSSAMVSGGSTSDNGQVVPIQATVSSADSPAATTPSLPQSQVPPHISGTPAYGQTLTCDPGSWSGSPTLSETWTTTAWTILPSAGNRPPHFGYRTTQIGSGPTLTVSDLLPGTAITCHVVATNPAGSATADSSAVGVQATRPAVERYFSLRHHPVVTGNPTITDQVGFGATNTCEPGHWVHYPTHYAYRWFVVATATTPRGHARIVGNRQQLRIGAREELRYVYCRVVASNAAGGTAAFSKRSFVPQLAPRAAGPARIQVEAPGAPGRIDPSTSPSRPLTNGPYQGFRFTCLPPAFNRGDAVVAYGWEVNSTYGPFYGNFPGQTLTIDPFQDPLLVDDTPVPDFTGLSGTVRCVVVARLSHSQSVTYSRPLYVLGNSATPGLSAHVG